MSAVSLSVSATGHSAGGFPLGFATAGTCLAAGEEQRRGAENESGNFDELHSFILVMLV
jgi:hypothetical protein